MLAQNPHAELLSLQADASAPDGFTLMLRCGIESFEVSAGAIVRVGLTGFQLALQPAMQSTAALPPVTIAGISLLEAIDRSVGQHWPNCSRFLMDQIWSGFSTAIDGFHQEPFYGSIALAEVGTHQPDFTLTGSITAADLRILEASGLWHHDIPPNSHGILERVVLKHLMQTLPTPICLLRHGSQGVTEEATLSPDRSSLTNLKINAQALAETIAELTRSSLDFLTLLKRSQLDPNTDLVGINLLGGDLRNLDLSNTNLRRSNLRGADLSDVDFTEANLSYARLSGADLSGALLSNANLRGANLHRASLALANLSGADLRGADLREANLSQVNLSGAQVAGVCWGNNEGISPSVEAYLQSNEAGE